MKSETFRKQALSLIVFFVAIAAVFALTRLRSDPAGKQAQTILTQLLSSSDAVEPAADDSYTASAPVPTTAMIFPQTCRPPTEPPRPASPAPSPW